MMMPLKALKALLLGAAVLCVVGNAGAKDEDNTAPAAAEPAATPEAPPTPKPEKKLHPIAKVMCWRAGRPAAPRFSFRECGADGRDTAPCTLVTMPVG